MDYHHHKGKHSHQKDKPRRYSRDLSKYRCYTCDEREHFARYCPRKKSSSHKKKLNKRSKQVSDDSSSDEEYVLISVLTGTITHGSNDWIIDSGASKHMIGFKESFVKLSQHESPHKV